jgi:fluoride exporter
LGKVIPLPAGFPLGTLIINLFGCFFLAWFFTITAKRLMNPNIKLAIGTGFTGAFTTFSTFSVETLNLMKIGHVWMAVFYVLSSILGGIILALAGYTLAAGKTKEEVE